MSETPKNPGPRPEPKSEPKVDAAAAEKAAKGAHIREQVQLLMRTSFCSKLHDTLRRPTMGALRSRALEERLKEIPVYEGDRDCTDCQRKLSKDAAALLLVVLDKLPTDKIVQAAKELRAGQPMAWAAIVRSHCGQIEQALARAHKPHFKAFEYQTMASELLADAGI